LLVLTSINILYNLANGLMGLGKSDEIEELETAIYQGFEESGTDLEDMPAGIRIALEEFVPDLVDNYLHMSYFELAYYLLLIIPVVLMFRKKKLGLWLYMVLQIIGSLEFLYFFRPNAISIAITVFMVIFAVIFILLYRMNRHALH
jgi:hypothetical protein